ncbi:transcriptional regulator GcvA [Janthinobacterium fluminis]|uniref:Transcriptional regulator GcvA n=1 Tax=Janthinobacterium fluminis TaxID=2987524 RepID=A0ABT5K7B9_9BURK|nr:transcriptional regulator GcvA [Janthinobacterium fluminis]MDC8760893.1 transcriptional regulator GcvA [Janthinobacterium fluminis]
MKLQLPPLHSLRAFEAAARHLNLSAAADELHVTKGAVSLQVKRLEDSVGTDLFERGGRRLALRPAGERYFEAVRRALRDIEQATVQLRHAPAGLPLTVSCTPGFAVQWLVPRLARFEAMAPHVDVRIKASNQLSDFARDRVDFAVRHGQGEYPDLCAHKIFDDELLVVAAAALMQGRRPPRSDAELGQFVLLHDEHRGDWRLWLEEAGFAAALAERGPLFTESNGAVEAVRAGMGLALLPLELVRADLAGNRLVQVFPESMKGRLGYYLVYPERAPLRAEAAQFRDWMTGEAAADIVRP